MRGTIGKNVRNGRMEIEFGAAVCAAMFKKVDVYGRSLCGSMIYQWYVIC